MVLDWTNWGGNMVSNWKAAAWRELFSGVKDDEHYHHRQWRYADGGIAEKDGGARRICGGKKRHSPCGKYALNYRCMANAKTQNEKGQRLERALLLVATA